MVQAAQRAWQNGWIRFEDIPKWMEENLLIITKAGTLIKFKLNWHQWHLWDVMLRQYYEGVPIRIIVLKARQLGISTFVEGLFFAIVHNFPHQTAFVCAHDDDASQQLFDKNVLFEDELDPTLRRPTRASSRKELIFKRPHHSKFVVQTAGKTRLGRAYTIQLLHPSEMAFWTHADQTCASVMQAVKYLPGTIVVIESTANGVGGQYYDRWHNAEKRLRRTGSIEGYQPVFFPWTSNPGEYALPLSRGEEIEPIDDDEIALFAKGVTPEQVKWRRYAIEDLCGGDIDTFKQEYPWTPDEAFRMSGRRALSDAITQYHRSTFRVGSRVRFEWDADQDCGVRVDVGDYRDRYWEVWEFPRANHDYTVGGDVMEGKLSDKDDERSEQDYSAGFILNRVTLQQDAGYHGRPDPDLFGEELLKAACFYNFAWASPEANSAGMAAILVFKRHNYSRVYQREGSDDSVDVKESPYVGWRTTPQNRENMIDDWRAWCRPDPISKFDSKMVIRSPNLVWEEEQFVYDKMGKRQHRVGANDDELFAAMIALQIHIRTPRTRRSVGPRIRSNRAVRTEAALSYAGSVDYGIDPEEDTDEFAG